MCRVSNLKLSCGTHPDEPHYRRADELAQRVRLTGTHMLPCLVRYLGSKDCCKELDIDTRLPEGHLHDSTCTYCSVVQPAWNKAINEVLGKIVLIFEDVWTEFRDDFRDPERQDHDEPLAMQKRIHDICSGALQAVVMWSEEQPWVEFDDGHIVLDDDSLSPLSTSSHRNSNDEDDLPGPRDPRATKGKGTNHMGSAGPPVVTESVKRCRSRRPSSPTRHPSSPPDASRLKEQSRPTVELSTPQTDLPLKALLSTEPKTPTKGYLSKHAVRGLSKSPTYTGSADHHHGKFSKLGYELILREQERRKKKLGARGDHLSG